MRIGIDMDGCLSRFNEAFVAVLVAVTAADKIGAAIHDPDWPAVWDWPQAAGYSEEQVSAAWKAVKKARGFWLGQSPFADTREALAALSAARDSGVDVYFITSRPGHLAKWQTEEWLERHGMDTPTVLIAERKDVALDLLDLDAYIDDKLIAVNDCMAMVRAKRSQARVYLKDAPYNRAPVVDPPQGGLRVIDSRAGRDVGVKVVGGVGEMLREEGLA